MLSMHVCAHQQCVPVAQFQTNVSFSNMQAQARHTAAVASAGMAEQRNPHAAAALQQVVAGVQPLAL